jgi:broad specificity phosphatase PhoE
MRRTITTLILLALAGVAACDRPAPTPTTVLVVRHAEKADTSYDPPLAEAGARRAQALVPVAQEAGVGAIYSSQFVRNRETVRPLAERVGVPITEMEVNIDEPGDYGQRVARDVLAKHRGKTVVVVSHLNTIPAILEGLTGQPVAPLDNAQYANLWVVIVPPDGKPCVVRAQYGQPDGV